MNDPEKAKYLEENLAAIPDCVKSAVNGCQGTLTNLSYQIDANGNISVAISGTNDSDGKIVIQVLMWKRWIFMHKGDSYEDL